MTAVICSKCDKWLADDVSAESIAEFKANFPGHEFDATSALCTDCYNEFWNWANVNAPELERKI